MRLASPPLFTPVLTVVSEYGTTPSGSSLPSEIIRGPDGCRLLR